MVAIKFCGLIVTFYLFVVLEVFGQNFYPARYGKRDDNESQGDKNLPEGKRLGRTENQEPLGERKIRFFISGGRFGKRGCTAENCFQESKEDFSESFPIRQDRSERIRVPIRKNQFMMGSRFGKRMEGSGALDSRGGENLTCTYTGIRDFYRCSNREEDLKEDNDSIASSSMKQFFQ